MDLHVSEMISSPAQLRPVEVVERKGRGHPDSICDAVAEAFSRRLCRFYRDRFGTILHHNVDKALLCGGRSRPAFGGGEVLEPWELILSGRATSRYRDVEVPLEKLALEASHEWLRGAFHALDPERHVSVRCRTRPGSSELVDLFGQDAEPLANDTSAGVGYAPSSDLESLVLEVERTLNDAGEKRRHPEVGEDIKLMAIRSGEQIELTLACAFVDRFVHDLAEYLRRKEELVERVAELARGVVRLPVDVRLNTGDRPERGAVYLTVTGTSAEAGDDGEVGRGNRINGLITPFRPMTLEAAAGKNPVTHVGKLYNRIAGRIAADLVTRIEEIEEAQCLLVSQIGRPVTDPRLASVEIRTAEAVPVGWVRPEVGEIVREHLGRAGDFWREWIDGEEPVC